MRASAFPFPPYSLFYSNGTVKPGGFEYDIVAVGIKLKINNSNVNFYSQLRKLSSSYELPWMCKCPQMDNGGEVKYFLAVEILQVLMLRIYNLGF
jgi:hypothetical protein